MPSTRGSAAPLLRQLSQLYNDASVFPWEWSRWTVCRFHWFSLYCVSLVNKTDSKGFKVYNNQYFRPLSLQASKQTTNTKSRPDASSARTIGSVVKTRRTADQPGGKDTQPACDLWTPATKWSMCLCIKDRDQRQTGLTNPLLQETNERKDFIGDR